MAYKKLYMNRNSVPWPYFCRECCRREVASMTAEDILGLSSDLADVSVCMAAQKLQQVRL